MSTEINRRNQRSIMMSCRSWSAVVGAGSSAGSSDRGWRGPRTSHRPTVSWSPPGDNLGEAGVGRG